MKEQVVVLRDPHDKVADLFIRSARETFGLRTVVLYTDLKERIGLAGTLPSLTSGAVAACFSVPLMDDDAVARALDEKFDVRAVVPQGEQQVCDSIGLAERLGIAWADPVVVRRFRDKGALKEHLRSVPGAPRINATQQVADLADIAAARATGRYDRFVLKPNDGTGNRNIGFFDAATTDDELAAFVRASDGPLLMEEFLDGQEYCVNGQVDSTGRAWTYSVQRTIHTEANGRPQLASAFQFVPRSSEEFAAVADYAEAVVAASGLRRSPFHMELIVDRNGPCMVECGARLVGAGVSWLTTFAHGGSLDVFDVALADYLGRPDPRGGEPDWATYDRRFVRIVCGIHDRDERVLRVQGADVVESLPEFVEWVAPVHVGQRVHVTRDLFQAPWIAALVADDEKIVTDVEHEARELIRINPSAPSPMTAWRSAAAVAARAGRRARGIPEVVALRPEPLPLQVGEAEPNGSVRPITGLHDVTSRVVMRVGALPPVRSTFENSPLLTPMLHRYMGGTTIDSALIRLGELVDVGLLATMHVRRGPVLDADDAEGYVQEYTSFVASLVDHDVQRGHELSIKLEQLGYKTPEGLDLAVANLHRVVDAAYSAGMRLTVDMEGIEEVDDTLAAVADVRRSHTDVGIVLQANLRRTEDDCRALAYAGSRVRLVKGGYFVTDEDGYRRRADVDTSYVRCLRILMEGQGYPMVATHDDRMLDIAHELARRTQRTSDDFEFQMLAGVREGRQRELVERGERLRAYFAYGPEWFPWMVWIISEKPSKMFSIIKGAVTG